MSESIVIGAESLLYGLLSYLKEIIVHAHLREILLLIAELFLMGKFENNLNASQ